MRISQWLNVPVDAPPSDTVRALRRSWKFAATCQFLLLFDEQLGVAPFQTPRLESALDTRDSYVDTLAETLVKLLPRPRGTPAGDLDSMLQLHYELRALSVEKWASLTALERVDVLHTLCEWQLDLPERLRRGMSDDDTVSWRVNPAGWDRTGNTYWLFDDNRLWIQRPPPIPVKRPKKPAKKRARPARNTRRSTRVSNPQQYFSDDSELSSLSEDEPEVDWIEYETICITRTEWEAFVARFASSKHPDERSLYKYINGEVLPRVVEAITEEESRIALERAMSNRKRSSRIALKESEKEEKERLQAEEQARIAREQAERLAAQEKAEREAAEYYARHSREMRLREREERLREREERLRARREGRYSPAVSEDAASVSTVEEREQAAPAPAPVSAPAPAAAGAAVAQPSASPLSQVHSSQMAPIAPSAVLHSQVPAGPVSNDSASQAALGGQVTFAASVPPAPPVPAASGQFSPASSGSPMGRISPTGCSVFAQPIPTLSPNASPTGGAHLTPPRMRPTGSFPLRSQLSRSPLSRAYEPEDEPSDFNLGERT
ncbi:DNA-directed RNA polymerase [Malassezia cuniculi]|uniref:DNA-directed RNA polymerase n=1 Tax=Malassezia cuniculi TaxID=948313 RepID=A0AAF0EWJ5_9BASI|nr:DNA-directed RNA polymerase [Malassezia cuniculi]